MNEKNHYLRLYKQIANEIEILDEDEGLFRHAELGVLHLTSIVDPSGKRWKDPSEPQEDHLGKGLAPFIYFYYYLRDKDEASKTGQPDSPTLIPIAAREDAEFGKRLRSAAIGTGYFEGGWGVMNISGDEVWVEKDGVRLKANRNEIRAVNGLVQGAFVDVLFPNDAPFLSPGFYMLFGNSGRPPAIDTRLSRVYFNLVSDRSPDLVEIISKTLNDADIPFSFKVLNDPRAFHRSDSAVLYLRRDHFDRTRREVGAHWSAISNWAAGDPPSLTKTLAPGIGAADEPEQTAGSSQSFGQNRSLVIAMGISRSYRSSKGKFEPLDAYEKILREFRAAGLQPDAPYLNFASPDCYTSLIQKCELAHE